MSNPVQRFMEYRQERKHIREVLDLNSDQFC